MTANDPQRRFARYQPLDADTARRLWQDYRDQPNEITRNALMEAYLPVVRYNAQRVASKLPEQVDLEDLVSAGTFGLIDAIKGFKPERGNKFETYCAPRVRGAILDELRGLDWVPRLVRSRSTQCDKVRGSMRAQHGIEPTDEEVRQELGLDHEEFDKVNRDSRAVTMTSLSRRTRAADPSREFSETDVLGDEKQINPLSAVQKRDLKETLTRGLSRSERLIVVLYYYEQMTMREIGKTLELSESRVSQMHTSILLRLRAQLQSQNAELVESVA